MLSSLSRLVSSLDGFMPTRHNDTIGLGVELSDLPRGMRVEQELGWGGGHAESKVHGQFASSTSRR